MKKSDEAFNATRVSFERRFLDATNNYQRFQVVKDLLRWLEDLYEVQRYKDAEIERLRAEVKGYDLSDYQD